MIQEREVNDNGSEEIRVSEELGDLQLELRAERIGRDWTVLVTGNASPHIGCAVLAVPRESLRRDGTRSSTASVLNVTGHKDEELCRYVAERLSAASGSVVVCTGGVHLDGITVDQIREIRDAVYRMTEKLEELAVSGQELPPGTDM